jgi:cephalosporin-C deacetylase-like acetyl esterase
MSEVTLQKDPFLSHFERVISFVCVEKYIDKINDFS